MTDEIRRRRRCVNPEDVHLLMIVVLFAIVVMLGIAAAMATAGGYS